MQPCGDDTVTVQRTSAYTKRLGLTKSQIYLCNGYILNISSNDFYFHKFNITNIQVSIYMPMFLTIANVCTRLTIVTRANIDNGKHMISCKTPNVG